MSFSALPINLRRNLLGGCAILALFGFLGINNAYAVSSVDSMPDKITFSVALRDFPYYGLWNWKARVGNPYFQNEMDTTGPNTADASKGQKNAIVVWDTLDGKGKPQFAGFMDGTTTWAGGSYADLKGYFDEMWGKKYKSNEENMIPIANKNNVLNVGLERASPRTDKDANGTVVKGTIYRYKWLQTSDNKPNVGFPGYFPIGVNEGWTPNYYKGPDGKLARRVTGYDDVPHNFSFTAELTGQLTLPKDTEIVNVISSGDDELWVFMNDMLVTGHVYLNGKSRVNLNNNIAYDVRPTAKFTTVPPKIVPGQPVTIKIFFAERKTPGSSVVFYLDVYTNDKLRSGSGDKLNISAKAVPATDSAKVWFDSSDTQQHAFTLE